MHPNTMGALNGGFQQTIMQAFNSAVYISDRMDVQHTPLYDTVTIAAGATFSTLTTALFVNAGPQSGKTLAQTNMTQAGRLPAPQAFSIFAIQVRIQEDILPADFYSVVNGFAINLILGQKSYQLAPIWYMAAGGGPFGISTTVDWMGNGLPSRQAIRNLAIPIVIENQMDFRVQFEGTSFTASAAASVGGTGITVQVVLDGLYARGVQ